MNSDSTTTYHAGFDVGTDSLTAVVLSKDTDANGLQILFAPKPRFHFGNPVLALRDLYDEILGFLGSSSMFYASFTGSGGERFARNLSVPYHHDTITLPAGAMFLYPSARYIVHMGARDAYFFELECVHIDGKPHVFVPDHGTGTKCGGGSGTLITKQCRRFFENDIPHESGGAEGRALRSAMNQRLIRIFARSGEAVGASSKKLDVGGRCGVVIQSDMIHLQNSGEKINDILEGLYTRIIKNYKADVIKARALSPETLTFASGGLFESPHLVSMARRILDLNIAVHDQFRHAGAVGSVIKAGDSVGMFTKNDLDRLTDSEKKSVKTVPALKTALENVVIHPEEHAVEQLGPLTLYVDRKEPLDPLPVILGIDGGSTTTKAVVVRNDDLSMIARICLYTNGKPLETIQSIFKHLKQNLGPILDIRAVAYTGSSGAFYHKLFTRCSNGSPIRAIDLVKDEITCHALGVKHFNGETDTIFELGGQDAKFTRFNGDGTVKKSRMNLSCMAGTGQTMQNMLEMIGLDINSSFHEYALAAERTPVVDDTCGVFTEAGIARLISLGFPKEEIAAAIAYGFMGGYVNTFIGNEAFGTCASAQGGPFTGMAPLAALAMHTGVTVHAFPHRQFFGALGAAIAAHREAAALDQAGRPYECRFRGLATGHQSFETWEKHCSHVIVDTCGIKDCRLSFYSVDDEFIVSGGACPKGNTDASDKRAPDYVDLYKRILGHHLDTLTKTEGSGDRERVLVPRALSFWNEKAVFYVSFYTHLGFDVVVSPESNDDITEQGLATAHSETCFPMKIAHGHASFLKHILRKGKDKLLLVNAIGEGKEKFKFCPYVSAAGFLMKDALGMDESDVLIPVLYFNDPTQPADRSFHKDLSRIYGRRFSHRQVRNALGRAKKAEAAFLSDVHRAGDALISRLMAKNERCYIGLGRGYTLFDHKAGSRVHELFFRNGLHYIPSYFLKNTSYELESYVENMYWVQGRQIIRHTLNTAVNSSFFPVRLTNFNCGSDSMLLFHEERIMEKAGKPHLVLQTDGHSSNAQFGTRILANHEVVSSFTSKHLSLDDFKQHTPPVVLKHKIIGIPYMGDHSHVLAATFRALGYRSEVMPTGTAEAQEHSRKLGGANICQPFTHQVGDSLAWIDTLINRGIDPESGAVIMEPMAKGPCRFGQYHVLLKQIIAESGFPSLDILSPDAAKDYSNLPLSDREIIAQARDLFKGIFCMDVLYDGLLRTRPYEKICGAAQSVYNERSMNLVALIEDRATLKTLVEFMTVSQTRFEHVINPSAPRRPIIAVTGEIYMRLNPHANKQSILTLEKYGLETRLAPLSLWMEYTNKTSIKHFKMANLWKKYLKAILKKRYMDHVSKALYEPFRAYLKGREPHDSVHIINQVEKDLVYDGNILGESPLSIGEAYMFAKGELNDISGIYHIGPFGCMQETAATSQIQSVIRRIRESGLSINDKIVPFMDAIFGDSELSNLDAEIAAFSEKCRIKHGLNHS